MSFRQFGGIQYAPKNNIVGSNYNSINNLQVTQNVGQPQSYINFLSDISGNYNVTANPTLSDYRIKTKIRPLDKSFTVDKLKPILYTNTTNNKQEIGVIAHELQEIYPFLVNGVKDGVELQSVNYSGLIGILINEIKDLKTEIKLIKQNLRV